jgi:hypothetical protein
MSYCGFGCFLKVYAGWLVGKCMVIHEESEIILNYSFSPKNINRKMKAHHLEVM